MMGQGTVCQRDACRTPEAPADWLVVNSDTSGNLRPIEQPVVCTDCAYALKAKGWKVMWRWEYNRGEVNV